MTQATERSSSSNPSRGQGFGRPQVDGADSGTDNPTARVPAEISQLRDQINQSLSGATAGLSAIVDEYQKQAQPLADEASTLIYDMLSNRTFFNQVGRNVAQLMAQHPMGARHELGKPTLKALSFEPLKQGTQQSYLTSAVDTTEG
jgi:hypothetical protein